MRPIKLAKNETSFQLLNQWHNRFAAALDFPFTTERVETSFGFTEAIVTATGQDASGNSETPVLILHGAMAGAPFALGELVGLPAKRKMFAINIPGQSTRASQVRLDFQSDEYGRWLGEVMDGLKIDRAILCGVSWGGSVALQMAKHGADRICGLILVVPGSIVRGPVLKNIWHVALPIMRYKLFPSDGNRDRALRALLTTKDALWSPYLGDAIRHWNVDFTAPPIIQPDDLQEFQAPTYVIAADQDLAFPGRKLLERSQLLFSNLVGTHLLSNSRHSPSFRREDRVAFTGVFENALHKVVQG